MTSSDIFCNIICKFGYKKDLPNFFVYNLQNLKDKP